ncbi:hypothetical protein [Thalassiella azotivora]
MPTTVPTTVATTVPLAVLLGVPSGAESTLTVVLVVLLVLGLLAWYLVSCATRLDRLHHRVETATAALDNQLLRRASAAGALATSGLLDPASALLVAGAAAEAAEAGQVPAQGGAGDAPGPGDPAREGAESDLSRALRATLTPEAVVLISQDPVGRDLLEDLRAASERAALARRFRNDAVSQAQRVRRKRFVRWTRLAGRARMPRTVELDDELPEALRR